MPGGEEAPAQIEDSRNAGETNPSSQAGAGNIAAKTNVEQTLTTDVEKCGDDASTDGRESASGLGAEQQNSLNGGALKTNDVLAKTPLTTKLRVRSTEVVNPSNFKKIQLLGRGDVGLVFLVKAKNVVQLNGTFAMKVYKKSDIVKRNKVARVKLEREILSNTNHPFVVSMYAAFQTKKRLYIILQYCPGGELYRMVKKQPNGRIPESWARFYAAEILVAVEYLHFLGYLYRDLKPENILLHSSGHVMIADFDLAKRQVHKFSDSEIQTGANIMDYKQSHARNMSSIGTPSNKVAKFKRQRKSRSKEHSTGNEKESRADIVVDQRTGQPVVLLNHNDGRSNTSQKMTACCSCFSKQIVTPILDTETQLAVDVFGDSLSTSFVGTIEYVAPEVIMQEGYSGSVDWWTFGVLLYEMVFGKTPFKGKDTTTTLAHVLNADIDFSMPSNKEVAASKGLRDLLPKLLARKISDRLKSPESIRSHPFFAPIAWPLLRHMEPPFKPSVQGELDTKNFRNFKDFVDTDSEFEETDSGDDGDDNDSDADGKGLNTGTIVVTPLKENLGKKNSDTAQHDSAIHESSLGKEEEEEEEETLLISPAVSSREKMEFKDFAYVDPKGEQHWDMDYSPPHLYGDLEHVRKDHIESPCSKSRAKASGGNNK